MSRLNVVYERSRSGWGASVPAVGINLPVRPTRQEAESLITDNTAINGYLMAKGLPSTALADERSVLRPVNRPLRIKVFTDRIDWLGPTIVLLSCWYFAAQVLVAWTFRSEQAPGQYNFFTNAISDLGATGRYQVKYPFYSPRWFWMDLSIGLLGAALLFGAVLIFTEFRFSDERRERVVAGIGFGLLALSGLGAILVACVPENLSGSRWHLHGVGTAITIVAGQLGIFVIGLLVRSIPDWLREFMIVASLIVLLSGISYALKSRNAFGFGPGALERIVQYPQSLWLILFGLYISREHWRNDITGNGFRFTGERSPDSGGFLWALRRQSWKAAPSPEPDHPVASDVPNSRAAQNPGALQDPEGSEEEAAGE